MSDVQSSPADVRRRLFNPPNGHTSSELDIVLGQRAPGLRRQTGCEAEFIRQGRIRRSAELLREFQFKLTAWVLDQTIEPDEPEIPKLTFEQILIAVGDFYSIPRIHIISKRRTADVIGPRHIAMYLGREVTELSLPMIGARMGDRDHTTVLYGANKIAAALKAGNEALAADIAKLKEILGAE